MEFYYFVRITESAGTVRNLVLIVYNIYKSSKQKTVRIILKSIFFQFVNEWKEKKQKERDEPYYMAVVMMTEVVVVVVVVAV